MSDKVTLIGIDGGASKVSANIVEFNGESFSLGRNKSTKEYKNYIDFQKDFKPVELANQLSQMDDNSIELTESEIIHANAYYSAFADAIEEIVSLIDCENFLIGIGMPGIKSADGRGIIVMANGSRMPNFSAEIEQRLSANNIALAKPIAKLGSDADYCGIGEEFAQNGVFKNVSSSYYLGGGTGAADALKLHGKLIPLDDCKAWFAKTWEFKTDSGNSMETFCSARGIQSIYSEIANISNVDLIKNGIYLEQILVKAGEREKSAIETWKIVSKNIAELIYERISTIYSGWKNNFSFINPNRENLKSNHNFKGTLLDKIVIGQRLGETIKMKLADEIIVKPILKHLSCFIYESDSLDDSAKSYYLKNGNIRSELFTTSELREAPALGAGIDAWNNYVSE